MPIRTPRRAEARTPQQILADLHNLRREWAESRPEGVCDALLLELLTVRPDLRERL